MLFVIFCLELGLFLLIYPWTESWSDNYFSIPAGQSITVKVSCPVAALAGQAPQLRLEGWNIKAGVQHLIP